MEMLYNLKTAVHAVTVHGYTTHHSGCIRTKVTARFKDGKLLNARNLAMSRMAGWGTPQFTKKVKCKFGDCWEVVTAGHGGYILVTQEPLPPCFMNYLPMYTINSNHGNAYVYQFEEDCEWAILANFDPLIRRNTPLEDVRRNLYNYYPQYRKTT